jgi:hypothetical protein
MKKKPALLVVGRIADAFSVKGISAVSLSKAGRQICGEDTDMVVGDFELNISLCEKVRGVLARVITAEPALGWSLAAADSHGASLRSRPESPPPSRRR